MVDASPPEDESDDTSERRSEYGSDPTRQEAIEALENAIETTRATMYDVAHGEATVALHALEELRGDRE